MLSVLIAQVSQALSGPLSTPPSNGNGQSQNAVPQQLPQNIPQSLSPQGAPQQMADPRQTLLEQMHEPALPDPVGFWPLAPGWWLLFILSVALCSFIIHKAIKWHKQRAYRRQALKEYRLIVEQAPCQSQQWLVKTLNQLLKKTFFSAYPNLRKVAASSYGKPWLELLDASSRNKLHATQYEKTLLHLIYANAEQAPKNLLVEDYKNFAKQWIQQHSLRSSELDNFLNNYSFQDTDPSENKARQSSTASNLPGEAHV